MLAELANLASASWVVWLLLSLGAVFCIVEMIVPGFGFFGISGIVMEAGAVVLHACLGGTLAGALILFLISVIFIGTMLILLAISIKKGAVSKTALIEEKTSIPINFGKQQELALKQLEGKIGVVLKECRMMGKALIGDAVMEVISTNEILKKGTQVIVKKATNDGIFVTRLNKTTKKREGKND